MTAPTLTAVSATTTADGGGPPTRLRFAVASRAGQGRGAMRIGPAEIVAILIALSLLVGVVGWLYQFTRDR